MTAESPVVVQSVADVARPISRPGYVLAVLTVTFAVNFLDRQVVNIRAESIKRDLQISDTQLGLLMGTAFGLFYSTLGLPIARLADRYSRIRIITLALALWSVLTAACGMAQNYAQRSRRDGSGD